MGRDDLDDLTDEEVVAELRRLQRRGDLLAAVRAMRDAGELIEVRPHMKRKRHRVRCAVCRTPFLAVRSDAAYCSPRCRVWAHRHPPTESASEGTAGSRDGPPQFDG